MYSNQGSGCAIGGEAAPRPASSETMASWLRLCRWQLAAAASRAGRSLRLVEHRGEGDATEAAAKFPEEIATADHALATITEVG